MIRNRIILTLCMTLWLAVIATACGEAGQAAKKPQAETEEMVTDHSTGEEKEAESEPLELPSEENITDKAQGREDVYGQIIGISMAEMEEKLAAKESFFVYFATLDCPYCHDFHDMLVDYVQNHDVTMYQVILDYEEKPEEENRALIAGYFEEFKTVPGVFCVLNGENGSYLDTYNLGVGREPFHEWVEQLKSKVTP